MDSMELLPAVLVTAASVDDATAAEALFGRLDGQPVRKVRRMFGDSKYHNFRLYRRVEDHARRSLEMIRRHEGQKGWVQLPIRWTVERTFVWPGRCRRLSLDREKSVLSSESFIELAMIRMMIRRLCPAGTESEFRYRNAA